ncbi:MAG: hypothetical protein LQ347_002435 [Umbilicaria vellea]|nr:MAG: hypothetical protein LQ347_002435 [Umbilicaria vellea]
MSSLKLVAVTVLLITLNAEKKSGWENMAWVRYENPASKAEQCEEGTEEKKEARKKRREKRKKGDWEGLRWVKKGAKVVVENRYKKRTDNQVDQSTSQLLVLFLRIALTNARGGTQTNWCQPYVEDCPEPDQTNGGEMNGVGPIPTPSQSHTPQTGPGHLKVQEKAASQTGPGHLKVKEKAASQTGPGHLKAQEKAVSQTGPGHLKVQEKAASQTGPEHQTVQEKAASQTGPGHLKVQEKAASQTGPGHLKAQEKAVSPTGPGHLKVQEKAASPTGPGHQTVQEKAASENATWNRAENVQLDAPEGGTTQW